MLSHHMVIKGGKIANYHPYPPTPWNANPRDVYGTPGPYEDAVIGHARSSRRTTSTTSRASTSCGRCAASTRACRAACTCTSARARSLEKVHSPTQVANPELADLSGPESSGRSRAARTSGRSATGSSGCSTSCGRDRSARLERRRGAGAARHRALRRRARTRGASSSSEADADAARPLRRTTSCVGSLLIVHGLHPPTRSRSRVERRSSSVRPFLGAHGGDVELLDVDADAGAVRLRLLGSCDGCPSSAVTLQSAVERAILEAAPEIVIIDVEEPTPDRSPIQLGTKPVVRRRARPRLRRVTTDAARRPAADPRSAAARRSRAPGERCELCTEPIARSARPSRRPRQRATSCARAAAATCCSPPTARAGGASARCPTATSRSPTSSCHRGAVGRAADPGERRVLLRELDARPGRRVLSRARPGRPSRCSRSTRGTSRRRQPGLATLAPDVEAFLVRADRDGRVRSASSCRSTPATSSSAALRQLWRGFDGGREAHDALDAFFEHVARATAAMTGADVRGARRAAGAVRRGADVHAPAADHRDDRRTGARARAALPDPHRAAAADVHDRRKRSGSTSCSARRRGGATRCGRSCGRTWRRPSPAFTGIDRGRPPDHVHVRLRGRAAEVPPRARRRRDPARAAVRRHRVHAGRRPASRPSRWRGTWRRRSACRSRSGARRWTSTSPTAAGSACAATRSTRSAVQGRARARHVGPGVRAPAQGSGRGRREHAPARPTASPRAARSPTRCSTRATCCTRTGRRREEPAALAVRRARPAALQSRPTARSGGDADRVHRRSGRGPPMLRHAASAASRCSARTRRSAPRPTAPATWVRRTDELDVGRARLVPWDEAVEHEIDLAAIAVAAARPMRAATSTFALPAGARRRASLRDGAASAIGRVVRRREPVDGRRARSTRRLGRGPGRAAPSSRSPSRTRPTGPSRMRPRDEVVRHSLVAVHTLLAVDDGAFVSLLDPPEDAAAAVAGCANDGTFPVLVGARAPRTCVLSSPIILYDHPEVAPESPGDLYDATEIDEILALRSSRSPTRRRPRRAAPIAARRRDHRPLRRHAAGDCGRGCTARSARSTRRAPRPRRRRSRACRGGIRASTARSIPAPTPCASHGVDVRKGTRGSPPPGAPRRRPRPVPRRPRRPPSPAVFRDVDGERARRGHARRRPGDRGVRVAGALPLLPSRRGRAARDAEVDTVTRHVLVAGIGNIFFGDDGFGVEVADRLARRPCPRACGSPTSASAASTSPTSCSTATTSSCSSTRCRWARRRARVAVIEMDPIRSGARTDVPRRSSTPTR